VLEALPRFGELLLDIEEPYSCAGVQCDGFLLQVEIEGVIGELVTQKITDLARMLQLPFDCRVP